MSTLLEIRTRIRQRTDNEHEDGDRLTDTELTERINTKYKKLYGMLAVAGLHRTESTQTISPTSLAASSYALNVDFYAVLGVYRQSAAGEGWTYLTRHDHRTMPDSAITGDADTYRVVGTSIEFNPIPVAGTYRVKYVPVPGTLVDDADTIDDIFGWDEVLVLAVSIDIAIKEEAEPDIIGVLRAELRDETDRVKLEAQNAELSEGVCVAGVRGSVFNQTRLPGSFNASGYRGSPWSW